MAEPGFSPGGGGGRAYSPVMGQCGLLRATIHGQQGLGGEMVMKEERGSGRKSLLMSR